MNRLPLLAAALALLAPAALSETATPPQDSWMVHMDGSGESLRYVPDRIVLTPGGTVQLMIFGSGHGRYSITLDGVPGREAEVDTANAGVVHVAEFAAPATPGDHPFHDKHHPSAKGVLEVRTAPPVVGVGNGYDTQFYPARLEVHAGEPITFRNNASEIIHTMTAEDGSFDADAVRAGDTRTLTAPTVPGEYAFICKYHADSGTLVVLPARAASPQAANATAAAEPASTAENAERANTPAPALLVVAAALALAALAWRKRP